MAKFIKQLQHSITKCWQSLLHHQNKSSAPVDTKLFEKLEKARKYANSVCLMGAANIDEDLVKNQRYAAFLAHRYHAECHYEKQEPSQERWFNRYYSQPRKWQLQTVKETQASALPRDIQQDILYDPIFHLTKAQRNLLRDTLRTQEQRFGSCGPRAHLIAAYLWEHSEGIRPIEVVCTDTFEHAFVIVNREGDIKKPKTWGDAWIVDGWYLSKGVTFHAQDFEKMIRKIKAFARSELVKLGWLERFISRGDFCECDEVSCKVKTAIEPSYHLFPKKLNQPFTYYYEFKDSLTENSPAILKKAKAAHQLQFKESLQTINRSAGNLAFFQLKQVNKETAPPPRVYRH